jgi:hypothetical protein
MCKRGSPSCLWPLVPEPIILVAFCEDDIEIKINPKILSFNQEGKKYNRLPRPRKL